MAQGVDQVGRKAWGGLYGRRGRIHEIGKLGDASVGNAAWGELRKVGKIHVQVEGDSMHGDPTSKVHAYSAYFFFFDPDSRVPTPTICANSIPM